MKLHTCDFELQGFGYACSNLQMWGVLYSVCIQRLKGEMSAKKERFRSRGKLSEREKPDIFSFRNISTSQKSWVMKAFHCTGRAEMLQSK